MYSKHHDCAECGASYRLKHDLEDKYYIAGFCPFCGCENDEDQQFDSEDEDEE